jgi:hydrogenase maturation protease
MNMLIAGIGNPLRSDDGVGNHVIEALRREPLGAGISLKECLTSFDIFDEITEYETILIVDAIKSGGKPGTIHTFSKEQLNQKPTLHTFSSHATDFLTLIEIGERLYPGRMPDSITLLAVEAEDVSTISDKCTPQVEKAIPDVVQMIMKLLDTNDSL